MEQENIEWRKWRWEFLRRNKQYRKDFSKLKELRKTPNFDWVREKEFCKKWGLNSSRMPNPDKSFEEIIETKSDRQDTKSWAKNLLNKRLFFEGLSPGAVKEIRSFAKADGTIGLQATEEDFVGKSKLILSIDFNKVNSFNALQDVITELMKRKFDSIGTQISDIKETEDNFGEKTYEVTFSKKPKKSQTYLVDYDIILQVGDMKEKGFKNREIAKELFPRQFNEDNENANPESAIRKISNYWKKYRDLVNGGYSNITFP
jgi:hypothetical protein